MSESNTMRPEAKCPQCGGAVPSGAPEGLCPGCLLKQGTETATQPRARHFDPPPIDEVRRMFPQLEILALLGSGGMGAVFKARQPALNRYVALKILPAALGFLTGTAPKQAGAPESPFAERFNREARALARLSHPNIVAVYEFGQAGDLPYFIMEFVDGANLRQLQRERKFSPREALGIIGQICDALQYAHDEGVVHRDIKPENILVDRKGRVKIADFGLAKMLDHEPDLHLTAEGQSMGTPHYMAPEQVEHPQTVDHRADIFSLGVVFYELLTGELPIGKFPPPSRKVQIDFRLDDVVLRALEKEPERRYQQASEVRGRVETILQTQPPGNDDKQPDPRSQKTRKSAWRGFLVIVLLMVLLLEPIRWTADMLCTSAKNGVVLFVLGEMMALTASVVAYKRKWSRMAVVLAACIAIACISFERWKLSHNPRRVVWDRLQRQIIQRLATEDVEISSSRGHQEGVNQISFAITGTRKSVPLQVNLEARDMRNGVWNVRGTGNLSNMVFDVRTGPLRFYWLRGGNPNAHFPTSTNDPSLTKSKATPDFSHAELALGAIERLGDQFDRELEKADQLAANKTINSIVGMADLLRNSVAGTPLELPNDRYLLCVRTREAVEEGHLALANSLWKAFGAVNSRADEDYSLKISALAEAQWQAAEEFKWSLDPRITQLDTNALEERLKEVQHKVEVGAATPLEYKRVKAKLDIAAALAQGDTLEATRLGLELADAELDVVQKMAEVGRASPEEVRAAKYRRDHAQIEYKAGQEKRASLRPVRDPLLGRE